MVFILPLQYKQALVPLVYFRFEKVCGAPSWARMRWEKEDSENGKTLESVILLDPETCLIDLAFYVNEISLSCTGLHNLHYNIPITVYLYRDLVKIYMYYTYRITIWNKLLIHSVLPLLAFL